MPISIAVDGPAGAGKSTAAKGAAKRLGYIYVDTGALYRSIAYYTLSDGADPGNRDEVAPLLKDISPGIKYIDGEQRVFLNDEDVSDRIRTPEVSMGASAVSAYPEVRAFLLGLQRSFAEKYDVIMDGRDIGTVVLPDADVKIFLTASAEVRAKRRFDELTAKGGSPVFEEVLADINQRDYNDMHRDIAPLKQAADAFYMDTSDNTPEQVLCRITELAEGAASGKFTLTSGGVTAVTVPDGAELVSLKSGGTEYIWQADPDIWGRHAPVLFPFICSTDSKSYTVNGKVYPMSNHGFARDSRFFVSEKSAEHITYKLIPDDAIRGKYPFGFELAVSYTLDGNKLENVFSVKNTGSEMMPFFIGGHPGFNCPLTDEEDLGDYSVKYECPESIVRTIDGKSTVIADGTDTIPLDRELFRDDVFMKDKPASAKVSLIGAKSGKGVSVSYDRAGCIAVWSPYRDDAAFVCLEPWTSVPVYCEKTEELTEMERTVKLAPGEVYDFRFTIEIF